jgi:hypothetical protein
MAFGFVLITAVLVGILLHSPYEIISTDSIPVSSELGIFGPNTTVCQANARIPASTAALRMSLVAYIGPAVGVTVSHEGRLVASGHHNAGWVSSSLTLPIQPTVATPLDVKICLTRDRSELLAGVLGHEAPSLVAATSQGAPLPGRMRIEYLARGHRSWLSLAKDVSRRLGLLHAPIGAWIVLLLAAMMAIAVSLSAWLLLREQRYE